MLADFERTRDSDPLVIQGAAESQATKLLTALDNAKAITRGADGNVRIRAGCSIPTWLPQTPTIAKLGSVMHAGLVRAEVGDSEISVVERPNKGTKQA